MNVGIVAFEKENGVIAAYNTFIYREDLRTYKNLVFCMTFTANSHRKLSTEDIVLTVSFYEHMAYDLE